MKIKRPTEQSTHQPLSTKEYKGFLGQLKSLISKARYTALQQVNEALINLYRDMGEGIVEKQQLSHRGDGFILQLSKDLTSEYGKGYSKRNLLRIVRFYLTYKDDTKVATVLPQISRSHHTVILDKCNYGDDKDDLRRLFYLKQTIIQKRSFRDLSERLSHHYFESVILQQTNFKKILPDTLHKDASLLVQDAYDFTFLGLEEPYLEKKLEDLMVQSIEKTLKTF